jgi:hypothetical protein
MENKLTLGTEMQRKPFTYSLISDSILLNCGWEGAPA